MKKADLFFNVLRLPVDFVMLAGAGIATYLLRTRIIDAFRPVLFEFDLPLLKYLYLVVFVSLLFVAVYAISGLYSLKVRMSTAEEFSRIAVASSAGILIIIIYIFLRQELFNSRFLVLGGWFFAICFVSFGRLLVRRLQHFFVSRYDFGIHRVLIIGDDAISETLVRIIEQTPSSGYRMVKHLLNPELSDVAQAVGNPGVDEVILANPNYPAHKIVGLVDFCHEHHVIFKFVPNIYQTLTTHFDVDVINNTPLIELKRTALDGWGRVFKRMFDTVGALAGLVAISPLLALVAFAIKWESEGPAFARLKRISRNREFLLYKFRSMVADAEELKPYLMSFNERTDGPLFKMHNDPRVTAVGHALRRYRLDEFPQLINVLRGDISLVGPRPHQPDEIERYEKHHKKVLAIKAGMTGLAQVSGSSDLTFEEEVVLDSFYIENWSLWLDVKILFRTVIKMFSDRSAV